MVALVDDLGLGKTLVTMPLALVAERERIGAGWYAGDDVVAAGMVQTRCDELHLCLVRPGRQPLDRRPRVAQAAG